MKYGVVCKIEFTTVTRFWRTIQQYKKIIISFNVEDVLNVR